DSFTQTFSTAGPHTIKLDVTDNALPTANTATASKTVSIPANQPPAASFTFSPAAPLVGQSVKFTSTSTDPDGTIASAKWDLDEDGAYDDATGATATRKFTVPGSNPVGVRVTDDRGAVATSTMTLVVVPNKPPVAVFGVSPDSPVAWQP